MTHRVLIVGLGRIGKRHLGIARELLPAADIRVLRHQQGSRIPDEADGCFYTIEDALAYLPTIAVLANPAPLHVSMAQKFAASGVHLLVEKPISSKICGVPHLLKTCQRTRSVLMTGYNLRFLPSLQRFRDLVKEGVVGQILSVRCEVGQYLPSWRPGSDYRRGVTANASLGGGALLELSHEIDYIRWIFGEIAWVSASLSRQSQLEIDVEDTVHLTLGFKSDSDGQKLIAAVTLDLIRHDKTRICMAIGDAGSLRWNSLTGEVSIYRAGGNAWSVLFRDCSAREQSYRAEWQHFLDCVNYSKVPLISGEDGLKVLEVIEAAIQSDDHGRRVTVGPVNMLSASHT